MLDTGPLLIAGRTGRIPSHLSGVDIPPLHRSFPWCKLLPYCLSQVAGAVLAGAANLIIFGSAIARLASCPGGFGLGVSPR